MKTNDVEVSFYALHEERKNLIKENKLKDHIVFKKDSNILLSAPHGVPQVRNGQLKFKEVGSLTTALHLYNVTNCSLIAKTKNNFDDANFDFNCSYRKDMYKFIKDNNIRYLIDFHGLAEKHNFDVNLGTHLGKNIESDKTAFDNLHNLLIKNGFNVSIDKPFMAGATTIAGSTKNMFDDIWTIQIEINCGITNKKENFKKYKKLLNVFYEWIDSLSKV